MSSLRHRRDFQFCDNLFLENVSCTMVRDIFITLTRCRHDVIREITNYLISQFYTLSHVDYHQACQSHPRNDILFWIFQNMTKHILIGYFDIIMNIDMCMLVDRGHCHNEQTSNAPDNVI